MAGRAKLRRPHKGLEEGFFVKLGLGLDQLLIEVLEDGICAVGKRVMDWFIDGVIRVAFGAVDMGDRVARGAGNAGLGGGMVYVINIRVVKSSAEEGHDVVAAGAPARGFDVAVAFERDATRFPHAEEVRFIVERTETVGAVKPAVVGVLMAIQTVAVHHQSAGGNEITGSGPGQRRLEIFFAFARTDLDRKSVVEGKSVDL